MEKLGMAEMSDLLREVCEEETVVTLNPRKSALGMKKTGGRVTGVLEPRALDGHVGWKVAS